MLKISIERQLTSILSLKNQENAKKEERFYCPVIGCLYQEGSARYFKRKTLLAQHIGKVHAEKIYACSKCNKGFGTDWLRKSHEEFCGRYWYCSCGHKYLYRESLLTHARRSSHVLPEDAQIKPKKLQQTKPVRKSCSDAPVVLLIQPVIHSQPVVQQPVHYVLPVKKNVSEQRLILPKVPRVQLVAASGIKNDNAFSTVSGLMSSSNVPVSAPSQPGILISNDEQISSIKCFHKTVAETQTSEDYLQGKGSKRKSLGKLESRGSQCSGRKQALVRNKSTHTQTLESAVGKMKKRSASTRSRKKSVAVVTDEDLPPSTQELWSEFEDFLLKLDKYSASTQTNGFSEAGSSSKVFRDSQTVTEEDYLLGWNADRPALMNEQFGLVNLMGSNCASSAEGSASADFSLNTYPCGAIGTLKGKDILQESVVGVPETIAGIEAKSDVIEPSEESRNGMLSLISSNNTEMNGNIPEQKDLCMNPNLNEMCPSNGITTDQADFSDLDQAFDLMLGQQFKSETPMLSHIQTQTNTTDPLLDYGLLDLANMETQTTEDLLFSDLEFSDTETQTPWDDIQTVGDNLPVDQLSIEIQTDFSSILSCENPVGGRSTRATNDSEASGTSNLVFGRHMETQTHNDFQAPEFIHSEVQTHMDMDCPFF